MSEVVYINEVGNDFYSLEKLSKQLYIWECL